MEPGVSLPNSRQPATCTYHKPHKFSPWPHSHCLKTHFNIVLFCVPRTSSGLLPSGFPAKTLHASVFYLARATCTAQLSFSGFYGPLLTNSTRDVSFRVCCSQAHVALAVFHTHWRTVSDLVLLCFKTVALKTTQNQMCG